MSLPFFIMASSSAAFNCMYKLSVFGTAIIVGNKIEDVGLRCARNPGNGL